MPKGAVLGRGRAEDGTAADLTSFAEIARELGVTPQTIEKSYWRAVEKLRNNPEAGALLAMLNENA